MKNYPSSKEFISAKAPIRIFAKKKNTKGFINDGLVVWLRILHEVTFSNNKTINNIGTVRLKYKLATTDCFDYVMASKI